MSRNRKRGKAKKGVHVRVLRDNEMPKDTSGINADVSLWPQRKMEGGGVRATIDLAQYNLVMGTDYKSLAEVEEAIVNAKTQKLVHPMNMTKRDPAKEYRDKLSRVIMSAMYLGELVLGFKVSTVEEDAKTLEKFLADRGIEAKPSEVFRVLREIMAFNEAYVNASGAASGWASAFLPRAKEGQKSEGIFKNDPVVEESRLADKALLRSEPRWNRNEDRPKPTPFPHIVLEKTGPDLSGTSSERMEGKGLRFSDLAKRHLDRELVFRAPTPEEVLEFQQASGEVSRRLLIDPTPVPGDFDGDQLSGLKVGIRLPNVGEYAHRKQHLADMGVEIPGYQSQPKHNPTGAPRISPIRAFGESEIRRPYPHYTPIDRPLTRWGRVKAAVTRAFKRARNWLRTFTYKD